MELDHYIPGRPTDPLPLLSRYHSPIPTNVARAYIEAYTEPGDLILDPFGYSPSAIREAVATGRRIVAASANPVVLLATRGFITLPAPDEVDALTTYLADSPKMGHTLRQHLDDLYRTHCPLCGRAVIADYFIWENDPARPVEKVYHCPPCGGEQHGAVDQTDRHRLATIEAQGLHYHYLLERLAGPYDEHRPQAQRLLDLYTPRNLYALANLTMKVETTFSDASARQALSLILLRCLDACSKLNARPWDPAHPRRLRPPERLIELNVWRAFETIRQQLRQQASGTPLAIAEGLEEVTQPTTDREPKASAWMSPQSAQTLAAHLPPASAQLVLATLPPPDPVFYGLSFLWTGWLYGRRPAARLEPLLKQRGHDWSWYERALGRTLAALRPALRADSHLILIGHSRDPSYVEAILMAASQAALSTSSILYQPVLGHVPSELFQGLGGEYRITLSSRSVAQETQTLSPQALAEAIQRETIAAAEEVLRARSEPLAFDWLQIAAWQRLSETGLLSQIAALPDEDLQRLTNQMRPESPPRFPPEGSDSGPQRLADMSTPSEPQQKPWRAETFFQPLELTRQQVHLALESGLGVNLMGVSEEVGAGGKEPQPSHWWLSTPGTEVEPLSDRVERAVLQKLTEEIWVTEEMVYRTFPGLMTPAGDLVGACLRAYGTEQSSGVWQLRPGDTQETWDQVSQEIIGHLVDLGQQLDYRALVAPRWDSMVWPSASTLSPRAGVRVPSWLDVLWLDEGQPTCAFTVRQTAFLSFLLSDDFGGLGLRRYVVLPEERTELAWLKVLASPLLRQAMAQLRWDFIKFQSLRRLAMAEAIERHHLRVIVGLTPIIEQPEAQIPLF